MISYYTYTSEEKERTTQNFYTNKRRKIEEIVDYNVYTQTVDNNECIKDLETIDNNDENTKKSQTVDNNKCIKDLETIDDNIYFADMEIVDDNEIIENNYFNDLNNNVNVEEKNIIDLTNNIDDKINNNLKVNKPKSIVKWKKYYANNKKEHMCIAQNIRYNKLLELCDYDTDKIRQIYMYLDCKQYVNVGENDIIYTDGNNKFDIIPINHGEPIKRIFNRE